MSENQPLQGMAFSPSRTEALDCPYRFKNIYLDKRKEATGIPAEVGRLFHEWIAAYSQRCLEMETRKLRDLSWIKIFNDLSGEAIPEVRDITHKLIESIMNNPEWELPFDPESDLIDIEQKWGFTIEQREPGGFEYLKPCGFFDKQIDVRMIADLVWIHDGVLNIMDHKSGWGDPWDHQLDWYAAGAYSRYHEKAWSVIKIHYHWPAKDGLFEEVGFFNRGDLPAVVDQVIDQIYEARTTKEFPAKPCRACSWCGFKAECPRMAESARELILSDDRQVVAPEQGEFKIIDQRTAERALQGIVMIGARIAELEDELKEWVKINGPVETGGKRMEQRETRKWECTDLEGIAESLSDELNITVDQIVKASGMSKTALLRLLRNTGNKDQLDDFMERFGVTELVTNEPRIYKGGK